MMNNKVQVQLYIPRQERCTIFCFPRCFSVAQAAELLASFFAGTLRRGVSAG